MTGTAYITDMGSFLPNEPVTNDQMEQVLGMVGGRPSRARRLVLRNNGIQTRYYAIDPQTGKYTHNNAQLAAEAVRAALQRASVDLQEIELLSCGTSSPDQFCPAHAHMVHGELAGPPCEVVSTAGVCTSGISALKYAYFNVLTGTTRNAVASGSEFVSSFMRAKNFQAEVQAYVDAMEKHPELAFEKDFLRWMLSDGAGAALIKDQPNPDRLSLRIDWIDMLSFAGDMPVCMYGGAIRREDGSLKPWREVDHPNEIIEQSYYAVKQDSRLLGEHIMPISVRRALLPIAERRHLKADDVTWFLPHYSSEFFRKPLHDAMAEGGFAIPFERWFTNLTQKGNIGSAAIYLILEEMLYSGRLNKGDRLLCYIPESSRFSISYMHLTVV